MKKFLTLALVGAMVLGVSSVVYANICAFDPVPAATLLFPFVQYDYNGGDAAVNTLFAITNVSSEAQVVHVTLWTDYSVAILDFNILLTGYDVQTMTIRDILANGDLPVTYHSNTNAGPTPNSDGPVSFNNVLNGDWIDEVLDDPQPTGVLVCDDGNPEDYEGGIDQPVLDLFKGWLQKSQVVDRDYSDDCNEFDPTPGAPGSAVTGTWWLGDNTTRATWMYITADVVTECNKLFPDNPNYFDVLSVDNVLIGDVIYLDPAQGHSEAVNAVQIEADWDVDHVVTWRPVVEDYLPITFYARYANGVEVGLPREDYREPLPTAWAFRYLNEPAAQAQTWIRAWKGATNYRFIVDLLIDPASENVSEMIASNCLAYTYYAWDEAEDVTSVSDNPWSQPGGGTVIPNLLPLETQEVNVNEFTLPDAFGWMLFVWPASNYDMPGAPDTPDFYQTYMQTKISAFGTFTAAKDAHVMANYNCFSDQVLPNLGIDYKYIDPTHYYKISPMNMWNPPALR
jgi:hypothetical protein